MADALGYLRGCCWAWLLCALAVVAHAQPAGNVPLTRFTVFAAKPIPELGFIPRGGAPLQSLTWYPTARSPRYEYRGAMPLRFVDGTSGKIVAEATIPPDVRDPLLLFMPIETPPEGKPKTALKYQVAVLDDGAARHGVGGLAIINLSGLALTGTVNQQPVTLRNGLNPTIAVGRSAAITLRTSFNKKSYQSFAATVPLTAKQRALVILFPPFNRGSLEVQSRVLIDEPSR